jgi:hypothetical protein
MMHITDGCARDDGGLDHAEVFLCFAKEFIGLMVICHGCTFFDKCLRSKDKVEEADVLLALTSELNRWYQGCLIVAHGILGIDQWIMMMKVDFPVEETSEGGEGLRNFVNMLVVISLMLAQSGLK